MCIDIKLTINGTKVFPSGLHSHILPTNLRWDFGSCSSGPNPEYKYNKNQYTDTQYTERCCVKPGKNTLICHNKETAQGWAGSYIEIEGHTYCDDFISFKAMRTVTVTGKHVQIKSFNSYFDMFNSQIN